jgi:hypothetical protein
VLFTAAFSALLLAALEVWEARAGRFPESLLTLGANALTAWVLQYLLIYYPLRLLVGAEPFLPLVPGLGAVAVTVTSLVLVTLALGQRGIRIRL